MMIYFRYHYAYFFFSNNPLDSQDSNSQNSVITLEVPLYEFVILMRRFQPFLSKQVIGMVKERL